MSRLNEMEHFLNMIVEEIQNSEVYNKEDVYDKLCVYGLAEEDIAIKEEDTAFLEEDYCVSGVVKKRIIKEIQREAKINGDKWMKTVQFPRLAWMSFAKTDSFMYFRAKELEKRLSEFRTQSSIKMYMPMGKMGSMQLLHVLLPLLDGVSESLGDIVHDSKLASEIRTDDFVVRVNTREEAEKIAAFINSKNEYEDMKIERFSDALIKPNPFVLQENNIGYASDRNLSYNANVANMIYEYVSFLKTSNTLGDVSVKGFESFVMKKYKSLFIDGNGLEKYREEQSDSDKCDSFEAWLMNKMEVMDMLLIALNPENGIEKFYEHYSDINDKDYNERLRAYFADLINGKKGILPLKPSQRCQNTKLQEECNITTCTLESEVEVTIEEKSALVDAILEQQQIIAAQEQEIDKLNSERKR